MCASLVAVSDELTIAKKSAQEAFKDDGVVRLLKAAIHKDTQEAKRLVTSGVNVNAIGEGGVTPLVWALADHDVAAMKILLDLGANPNQYVVDGVGPAVWLAAGGGHKEALKLLIDYGGDANIAYGNKSALMMAIGESHLDCAELLLQHGADINYSKSLISALDMAMLHVRFRDALWVLNHGYTHDLPMARRMLAREEPRLGDAKYKAQALDIVDRLLAEQQKK